MTENMPIKPKKTAGSSPRAQKVLVALACAAFCGLSQAGEPDLSKLPAAAKTAGVTYNEHIRPLFEASCVRCHSGDRPKAGLRLDTLESALKGSKEGKVIFPGEIKSPLLIAAARIDPESAMPPTFKPGQRGPRQGGPGVPPPRNDGGAPPPQGGAGGPKGLGKGGPGGGFGPPPKPFTTEQVALLRAWIEQGAR